jgi:hypothetical protein
MQKRPCVARHVYRNAMIYIRGYNAFSAYSVVQEPVDPHTHTRSINISSDTRCGIWHTQSYTQITFY